ncbi:hypothetical protein P153DRAFT_397158 [Dothidotthia symphoricarpi CBS 119687]|uniref:Ribonucleases P/MRP subunit Pop8-like domain-containing protein n=1 Tax=Dothidotthia symphoricarpi CBS 119687 TaxID=1392245 RepID=A0A6A6ABJ2_9PLEO|nr:uncharacterized protein P153DRAFT_397158 [Dothidotthia symphoricarpi CBS 119687]KAF2128946.1 hypothetical protein P153DRAFT_397158 [Dothidotthia symphoricarpi CBS 119687]
MTPTPPCAPSANLPNPPSPTNPQPSQKRKRKPASPSHPHILHSATFRHPQWTYLHLLLVTPSSTTPKTPTTDIDPIAVSTLLTHPLSAYLGTTGSAIPIDIVKTRGREVWVRVPRGDARAVRAGVSGWVGGWEGERVAWRVLGEGGVLGVGMGGGGGDVFGG